jgi:hypothetical protein
VAKRYSVVGNATNTPSATLPLFSLISTTNVRPEIHAIEMGADGTPADNPAKYVIQRCSSTGTPGSSVTPQAIDPDEAAPGSTSGLAPFSPGPTLTASAFLLQWAQNMRQAYRWACKDGWGIKLPKLASNGVALLSTVSPTPFNAVWCVTFEE